MTRSNVVAFPASVGHVLIPDGTYTVALAHYTVSTRFGRGSLEVHFKVTDYGPYFEQPVVRYYKVVREGKRSFRAPAHSAFNREFAAVFGRQPPAGVDAVRCYRDIAILANVRAVTTDHRQKRLPDAARYSVISELIGRAP